MIRIINNTLKYNFVVKNHHHLGNKSNLFFRYICTFSKNKKEKPEFIVPSIHMSKYN